MNPFYNPLFISKVIKTYFFDIERLRRYSEEKLRKYQDKCIKKIVKFAYTVPLYHDKYRKAGVHPNEITGLDDLKKLPFITKEDFKKYNKSEIISSKKNIKNLVKIETSGTTGKSLTIYVDMFDIVMGLFGYLRSVKEHGINWRKDKMTIIGDFAPHTAESGYIKRGLQPHLKSNLIFKKIQWLNTNDDPKMVIKEIDSFQPDFIGGYVGMLGHLALLKEQGFGKNISPRIIAATGSVLDPSLKDMIKKTFNTHLFEVYGATETGPIAYECKKGSYHIMSDLLHLEFFKKDEPVKSGEPGKMVVTKLYGRGTPIIRYTAINDIVSPIFEKCNCEISGDLIGKIYGRDDLVIYLPGGRAVLPAYFAEIYSNILYDLKTTKLKDTQIIQHSLTEIEIQVLIDKQQRNMGPSVDTILNIIKNGLQKKVGPKVKIITKEVKEIKRSGARIISNVDRDKFEIKEYI